MRHITCGIALAAAGLVACGSEVVVHQAGSSGGHDAGGQGGQGAQGGDTPVGGEAGAPVCGRTDDAFHLAVYPHDESEWGCTLGSKTALGAFATEGIVVYADEATLTIDGCPPNFDCEDLLTTTVDVAAKGLSLAVPLGAFVRVEVAVEEDEICRHALTIRNLPVWAGLTSFVPGDYLWLAAGDGTLIATQAAALQIAAEPLGCYPDLPKEDHRLRFSSGGDSVTVEMGEEREWAPLETPAYRVRNLRSHVTEGALAFGWWLVADPGVDF